MKKAVYRHVLLGMYPAKVFYEGPLMKRKYMTSRFNNVHLRLKNFEIFIYYFGRVIQSFNVYFSFNMNASFPMSSILMFAEFK
jgi:hypothetical protein